MHIAHMQDNTHQHTHMQEQVNIITHCASWNPPQIDAISNTPQTECKCTDGATATAHIPSRVARSWGFITKNNNFTLWISFMYDRSVM